MNGAQLAAVAAGGALGAAGRYLVVEVCARLLGRTFPWGTLAVNVAGSLLMGLALGLVIERAVVPEPWRAFAIAGVLGGFTTFSALAGETFVLLEQQRLVPALANVVAHVLLGGIAIALGAAAGRAL